MFQKTSIPSCKYVNPLHSYYLNIRFCLQYYHSAAGVPPGHQEEARGPCDVTSGFGGGVPAAAKTGC